MSYTTTLDGQTLQCRATIESREELALYIDHLQKQMNRMTPPRNEVGDMMDDTKEKTSE